MSAFLTENGSVGKEYSYVILRIPKDLRARQDRETIKKIILKTVTSFNANLRNSRSEAPSLRGSLLIPLLIVCLAFLPGAQAAPAPETPDPGSVGGTFNTADGTNALRNVTTGVANAAFGWFSLLSNTDGSFNTGVGAGTLVLNVGDQTAGDGLENTAVGAVALLNNITGFNNAAYGVGPLGANISGTNNTAIGNLTLSISETTSNHVCVGRLAGSGITTVDNNVILGHHSGVHPDPAFGQVSDRCFIANIHGAPVSPNFDPQVVMVDSEGRLGTFTLSARANDLGGFYPHGGRRQAVPQGTKDAVLNLKVDKLQVTVAQQHKQIETLTAQLKQQAAQIQKVSAQLEVKKPAAQVVSYGQ